MNILLDDLPTEYKGYNLNTDYRIGIRLSILYANNLVPDEDKIDTAIDLLWGNGVPTTLDTDGSIVVDYPLVFETIAWFMSCGRKIKEDKGNNTVQGDKGELLTEDIAYDFEEDDIFIYSAFMQQYHIDLSKENMHWFKFNALFSSLRECTFSDLQEIRTRDPLNYEGKSRAAVLKQKEKFKIKKPERVSVAQRQMLELTYGTEWMEHI